MRETQMKMCLLACTSCTSSRTYIVSLLIPVAYSVNSLISYAANNKNSMTDTV